MVKTSMEYKSLSEKQTGEIAASFGQSLKAPALICLSGDLGAGKSVFARALIQSLTSPDTEVPSPTYTLVQPYDSAKGTLYHFDLYRLEDPEEIYDIGWEDALFDGIVIVEWPQRAGTLLPDNKIDITIHQTDENERQITIHV